MDPITAVGLAASIIQIVELGTKVIKRLHEYQSRCKQIPESFLQINNRLPLLVQILDQTKQELDAGKADQTLRGALSPTLDGCRLQINDLNQVLLTIVPHASDSRAVRVKKALLSLNKESDVSRIHGRLSDYISTLTFYFAWSSTRPKIQQLVANIRTTLAVPDPSLTYRKSFKQFQTDTAKWFLDGDVYKQWKDTPASVLWLHGGPGCGKTTLSSAIVHDLEDQCRNDIGKACAYHFFTFDDKSQQRPRNMIKSLIHQLVTHCVELPISMRRLVQHEGVDLETALRDILASLPTVYLVIDALDECDVDLQDDLVEFLRLMAGWKLDHVHILVTSRKEQSLEDSLADLIPVCNRVHMNVSNIDEDIGIYVRARLDTDKKFQRWKHDQHIRQEIETALKSGAGGMFRWAACQMDDLSTCLNRAMVLRSLKNLPKTLDDTYDRILHSIDSNYQSYALQVLRWLAFARISLTVAQVSLLTGFVNDGDPRFDQNEVLTDPRDTLTICKSLVTVVEADHIPFEASIVRLAHFTVQQYLTSARIKEAGCASFYGIATRPTEALIAKQCIAYLTEFGSEANNPRGAAYYPPADESERFPLAAYALYEWNYHSTAAAPDVSVDEVALKFMRDPTVYYNCFLRFGKELSRSRHLQIVLKEACILGFIGVVTLILKLMDSAQQTASAANVDAASVGLKVDPDLMRWVEDFLNEDSDYKFWAFDLALREAVRHDHRDMLELLIDRQGDIKAAYNTILRIVAQSGRVDPLKWLQGKNVISGEDFAGRNGTEILTRAAHNGWKEVLDILLDMGADVNAADRIGMSPLHWATSHIDSVQLLLDRGAEVNFVGQHGTALVRAASAGSVDVVRLLLERGAMIDLPGPQDSPVHVAADRSVEILQLLTERGADLRVLNEFGETPFEVSCRTGNIDAARFLIAQGAAENGQDDRCTALQVASKHHRLEIVKHLIDAGADLNQALPRGTALQLAIPAGGRNDMHSSVDTVEYLLNAGADVNVLGPNGTALQLASRHHLHEFMEPMITLGADVNAPGPNGTALQLAATCDMKSIEPAALILTIRNLVLAGADVNLPGPHGTALQLAVASKDFTASSVVKFLVKNGADVNAPAGPNGTAMKVAVEGKNPRIVEILRAAGAK